ncbi:unnamed protein product [Mycena citricolor]|uniref:Uncharacterized protein n=1 Tax=Mycena citricolor TaxID=2018698 RepID=A0AAD2HWS9_9AGAR|nr:unnamed protein product [Mycena citricolor]
MAFYGSAVIPVPSPSRSRSPSLTIFASTPEPMNHKRNSLTHVLHKILHPHQSPREVEVQAPAKPTTRHSHSSSEYPVNCLSFT